MSDREPANLKDKGSRKYRERIHRESRYADTYKNLPYTFSKPVKEKSHNVCVECSECGKSLFITEDTVIVICGSCKHLTRINRKSV